MLENSQVNGAHAGNDSERRSMSISATMPLAVPVTSTKSTQIAISHARR